MLLAATAVLSAAPAVANGQAGTWSKADGLDISWAVTLELPGLGGQHQARVIAPRNFVEQLRSGTLRELELEVAPGPLNNALARAYSTRAHLGNVGVQAKGETSDYLVITLKDANVITYGLSATSGANRGSIYRVIIQAYSSPIPRSSASETPGRGASVSSPPAAADKSEPIGLLDVVTTSGLSAATQSSAGLADLILGAQPARLASPGALQSLSVGAARNQPIAIEVRRGSALERLLRSSLAGKKVIPKLKLELSEAGADARGTTVVATLSNVRILGSKRGNTMGMEVINLSYEAITLD